MEGAHNSLPQGWEARNHLPGTHGSPLFVNHNSATTTWIDPRPKGGAAGASDTLPRGWQIAQDADHGTYVIDHNTWRTYLPAEAPRRIQRILDARQAVDAAVSPRPDPHALLLPAGFARDVEAELQVLGCQRREAERRHAECDAKVMHKFGSLQAQGAALGGLSPNRNQWNITDINRSRGNSPTPYVADQVPGTDDLYALNREMHREVLLAQEQISNAQGHNQA